MFMPGDRVWYRGSKFQSEIGNKLGYIVTTVLGTDDKKYVVEFGNDAYTVCISNLAKFKPSANFVESEHTSRKRYDEDDESDKPRKRKSRTKQ